MSSGFEFTFESHRKSPKSDESTHAMVVTFVAHVEDLRNWQNLQLVDGNSAVETQDGAL